MNHRFHPLDRVGSTNAWIAQRAESLESGVVAYTLNQTAGRGRQGRVWSSTPGETLAFSLLLDSVPPEFHATWVPLLSGASVAMVVRDLGVRDVSVKWPNDVVVRGQKLAGVLVEVLPDGRMVVGIGINVSSTVDSLPDSSATSLLLQGLTVTDPLNEIIAPVVTALENAIDTGIGKNPVDAHNVWRDQVTPLLSTLGVDVSYENTQGASSVGRAHALADDGALVVSASDGQGHVAIHSGDVFHIERS